METSSEREILAPRTQKDVFAGCEGILPLAMLLKTKGAGKLQKKLL